MMTGRLLEISLTIQSWWGTNHNMRVTLQQQRDFYTALFGEESCASYCNEKNTEEEINRAISDCYMCLQYAIDRNDREEISYWRKMLQENKVQRREMLTI